MHCLLTLLALMVGLLVLLVTGAFLLGMLQAFLGNFFIVLAVAVAGNVGWRLARRRKVR